MVGNTARKGRARTRFLSMVAAAAMLTVLLPALAAAPAAAVPFTGTFIEPRFVNNELEGCRGSVTSGNYIPGGAAFICADSEYTNGNLGKGWNELDLVPHRLTTSLGNQATAVTTFNMIVAADNSQTSSATSFEGYDFISELVVNAAKSHASCSITSYDMGQQAGVTGGVYDAVYRIVQISQNKGTTCVFDYVERLSITSAEYSGSSLQSYKFDSADFSEGKKTIPIPVKEVEPQELDKTMTATQDSEYVWAISKTADATATISNTCDAETSSDDVEVTISWQRFGPNPAGMITVVTTISATNPSHRDVGVVVVDEIYGTQSGSEVLLDTETFGSEATPVVVEAGMTETVGVHTIYVDAGTTGLRDEATATYHDLIFPDVEIPGENVAEASATVEPSGVTKNATATITDVETISGAGLSFSVEGVSGASGSFSGDYELGDVATSVTWTSGDVSGDGSVTFDKTIYAATGTIGSGELTDVATLTGSDGFEASDDWTTDITVNTYADLTIEKTVDNNVLEGDETATFQFDVYDSNGGFVSTQYLEFGAGDTTKSVTIDDLVPDVYTVEETAPAGWSPSDPAEVDLTGAACAGTASFTNSYVAFASAEVVKVTDPVGFEGNWTFDLYQEAGETDLLLDTQTTTDDQPVAFDVELGEGSYYVLETEQDGWTSDGGDGCTFTVNLPADADTTFTCTFTNTYEPSVTITKTGDELSKGGDGVEYNFTVENTGSTGEAAGVPDLACVVTDTNINYTSAPFTLAAGEETALGPVPFTIPIENYDDETFGNTATVECVYPDTVVTVASAQSTWTTDLFHPSIEVTKSGPAYALPGDTVTYTVEIENTSDLKTPTLVVESITDTLAGDVTPVSVDDCYELVDGETCSFTYTYTIPDSATGTVTNEVEAIYNPTEFSNDVSGTDDHDITILAPAFTIEKECTSDEPVPQEGPATFDVTVTNTGNADLVVTVGDGIGEVALAVGESETFEVTVDGPFSGSATADNEVTATATLADSYLVEWTSDEQSARASCDVGSRVNVHKLTKGVEDPSYNWTFKIFTGPDGFDSGTLLATDSTPPQDLDFGNYNLDPNETYTLCETNVYAGWTSGWWVDLDGDGTYETQLTYDPNANPQPGTLYNPDADDAVPQDLGNRCVEIGFGTDFPLEPGETLKFEVDNTYPGGEPRTPGYWKNWSSCTSGGQYNNGTGANDPLNEKWTLDEALATNGGYMIGDRLLNGVWNDDDLKFDSPSHTDCVEAVRLLDKSDAKTGKKMASDAAYELATALLAARLNFTAMAQTCPAATQAAQNGQALLDQINFMGIGSYLPSTVKTVALKNLRTQALALAKTLDMYNNGLLCSP